MISTDCWMTDTVTDAGSIDRRFKAPSMEGTHDGQ